MENSLPLGGTAPFDHLRGQIPGKVLAAICTRLLKGISAVASMPPRRGIA
ncbi:hypothetical protein [Novosphingobium album (ex Hu et al. 2023)]|uniref:Uncharacterized protein n=1 Tax=Novosphingobium album (ex Hu et al. 2023) TaxID=2930093 RepID=A0ABT0AXI3_9SPHN|nr:hypothetical protein [Novosphingobium album (ex Hu et al. 2023)]MCJ2177536.1 hypothetical protein [Novosphingobium album (ex Hu et al. 2023)]